MATVNLSGIASVLATLFEDRIATQINRSVVLAQLLQIKNGTGKNIQWVARFGDAVPTGAVIADGADVTTYNSDTKVAAVLQFGTYHDAFAITGKARFGAMAAGNPAELEDLFAEEIMESVTRLAMAISTDLYDGDGSSDTIMGLVDATAGGLIATGTYAGINRSTYAQWAGNVDANGGVARPLTVDLMRKMRRLIYIASGMKPDLIVCDPVQHEKYATLFGNDRRYIQDVRLRGETIKLDGGMQVLEFDGIPVVEDVSAPSGKMLFLNTNQVFLQQLPQGVDAMNRSMGMIPLSGTPEEQYGAGKPTFTARINPLAVTGDAYKFQLINYPQIQVKRPNSCGILDDLETT